LRALKEYLIENFLLIGILAASLLVSVSVGTYQNWDSTLEFEAALNLMNQGYPFLSTGLMINQPPVGFYLNSFVFKAFGLSYANGVNFMTFIGLVTVALVYTLGSLLYGKMTALVAAALFSLNPWHIFMSRIFLIDNQYLFFSLLCLIVGIIAIRKNSNKLLLLSGAIFALAFMTKLFSIFIIIPLILIYYTQKPTEFKLTLKRGLLFITPSLLLHALWYGGFANQHFFGVYFPSDFTHPVLVTNPSNVFLLTLLVGSAGWLILIAASLSFGLTLYYKKQDSKIFNTDLICTITIIFVLGLNMLLVFGAGLMVPYISVFKYSYLSLPFFCLLSASLLNKNGLISTKKLKKINLKTIFSSIGLILVMASLVESTLFLNKHLTYTHMAFYVDTSTYYQFDLFSQHINACHFKVISTIALLLILLSLIRSGRQLSIKNRRH
jgi:4-amino-4-deoxy-L-arabinose transferase-like glycosyltransferase